MVILLLRSEKSSPNLYTLRYSLMYYKHVRRSATVEAGDDPSSQRSHRAARSTRKLTQELLIEVAQDLEDSERELHMLRGSITELSYLSKEADQ